MRQATSERLTGQYIHTTHPNLRGRSDLRYVAQSALVPCDLLILALPHGADAAVTKWAADLRQRKPTAVTAQIAGRAKEAQ